jgi:DNA-binding CsgD family transcriptional regulator
MYLTAHEQRMLRDALKAMVSLPLADPSAERWCLAVGERLRALLGGDRVKFVLRTPELQSIYSAGFSTSEVEAYERALPTEHGIKVLRARGMEVWSHRALIKDDAAIFYNSSIYHDYYRPHRLGDGIGYFVDFPGSQGFATLKLHDENFGHAQFGDKGVKLLEFLLPAFESGLHTVLQARTAGQAYLDNLDAMGVVSLVFDEKGSLIHISSGLRNLCSRLENDNALIVPAREIAQELVAGLRLDGVLRPTSLVRMVRLGQMSFRLSGCLIRVPEHSLEFFLTVTFTCLGTVLPALDELRSQFGLTRREATVALLIGQGHDNSAIAERLSISPHTVRRHTERVLMKLGVDSRRKVPDVLSAANAEHNLIMGSR